MPQIINTNIASLTAQRNLNSSQSDNQTSLQRLSSGLRINSAKDDAAGLAISTRFDSNIRGLNVAIRNAGDGISLAQTAEGALDTITENLQRIRELALQSSNATNTDVDRDALDQEAQQLIEEIGRVSDETNFNGSNLLNGDFEDATFQVGVNASETISFSIGQVTTDVLGAGQGVGITALGANDGDRAALGNSDLIINGISVSASSAGDDASSFANGDQSSIAKVATINDVSDETGVVAETVENTKAGGNLSGAAAGTGTFTINGVTTGTIAVNTDVQASLSAVTSAINAISDQTGVQAVNSETSENGIQLVADDGRNITVTTAQASGAFTEATTGINDAADATTQTVTGGYVLVSQDGSEIDIQQGSSGTLSNSGLVDGSYSGTTAQVANTAQTVAAGADGTTIQLDAGDLSINGVTIGAAQAQDDTASSEFADSSVKISSGIANAAAINEVSDQTGVTAEVNETIITGTQGAAGAVGDDTKIFINGFSTDTITSLGDADEDRTNAITAINDISGQTGVTAIDLGNGIELTAEDGRNVSVALDDGTDAAVQNGNLDADNLGLTSAGVPAANVDITSAAVAATTYSTVTLVSAEEITVAAGVNGSAGLEQLGFREGTYGGGTDGQSLSEVDISTVDGATSALQAIDNALETVNEERSKLGAVQNRFSATIDNLSINSENLSAANSRIRDADFAAETAELSRTQVLQQAGISILAQANSAPQQVLSLLQ